LSKRRTGWGLLAAAFLAAAAPEALASAPAGPTLILPDAPASGRAGTAYPQDPRAEVYNLRYYTHANFTRIVVDIGSLREYASAETRNPGRIVVDILQARINPIVREESIPDRCDYINMIRIVPKSDATVRVTADVDVARVKRYQVYHLFDPFRIVIDIYPKDKTPSAPSAPADPAAAATTGAPVSKKPQPARDGYSIARQLGLGIRTIVIDPGHGGADPGCLDASGLLEKDLTLDISLRLRDILRANTKFDVIMTRETDILVPLENRTVVANQRRADLFISIHINAFPDKRRQGIETFYLNLSTDPRVIELAARENFTTTKTIGEMDKIIQKIVQNNKIIESRDLAQRIQANLVRFLGRQYPDVKDLGTKPGPFWTLIGCGMPSVLIEVSHISNPMEAQRLKSEAYRQQIARGIYEGLLAYVQSLGKG
jgi:N-acetylmuramoyl-L-alanine amidase